MAKSVVCYRCGQREAVQREDGIMPDYPPGWALLTLAQRGSPVVNRVLCPRHARTVALFLRGVVTLEAEQLSLEDVPPF